MAYRILESYRTGWYLQDHDDDDHDNDDDGEMMTMTW